MHVSPRGLRSAPNRTLRPGAMNGPTRHGKVRRGVERPARVLH